VTTPSRTIFGFGAHCATVDVGATRLALWQVTDLERHVDRTALLAAENPAEPPYWAYLWTGARVLAEAVPPDAGRVVEVGCGLGLPGLVAAARGGRVTCVDRAPAPLAFVRASAAENALDVLAVAADLTTGALRARYDLVLAAEVLYERAAFGRIAAGLAALVMPGGRILLTDGGRIDTRAFYEELDRAGLAWRARDERRHEEGFPVTIRLVEITPR
jgi:predicted nicotinamide N-methyase